MQDAEIVSNLAKHAILDKLSCSPLAGQFLG